MIVVRMERPSAARRSKTSPVATTTADEPTPVSDVLAVLATAPGARRRGADGAGDREAARRDAAR
jgi:hypothetical protein